MSDFQCLAGAYPGKIEIRQKNIKAALVNKSLPAL